MGIKIKESKLINKLKEINEDIRKVEEITHISNTGLDSYRLLIKPDLIIEREGSSWCQCNYGGEQIDCRMEDKECHITFPTSKRERGIKKMYKGCKLQKIADFFMQGYITAKERLLNEDL
jgi:hypothetical protein